MELVKNRRGKMTKIKKDGDDLIIKIKCRIPFGVEFYNRNKIINLSLLDTNNEEYNFIQEFKSLEKQIIDVIPEEYKNTRSFISSIRSLDEKIGQKIIRTYISKKKGEEYTLTSEFIKTKHLVEATIKFDSVWTSQTSYGVMVNILDVKNV